MLEELRIESLGIIDSTTLELGPGLTVITGETGAGKTMVVTALGLLLGARADTTMVRSGARTARIEGLVATAPADGFAEAVEEAGGEVEDGGVLLARTLAAAGRSRAFVGGAAVPVSTLAGLAEPLVAVHGQSDQHRLLRPAAQRAALDRFAGEDAERALHAYRDTYDQLRAAQRELAEVSATVRERAREADLLRFGLGEIEAVDPKPGEDGELAAEESRLGFADTLRTAAERARESLSSDTGASDALAAVAAARSELDAVRDHDPDAAALADRLAEVSYLLTDVAADVASYCTDVDSDPARLAAVSQRRSEITALTRKYGEDVGAVLAWAEAGAARLLELDTTDERITELTGHTTTLRGELARRAAALSGVRTAAAARLGEQVTAELTALAMPHAVLTVAVRRTRAGDDAPADPPADEGLPAGAAAGAGRDALEVDGERVRFGRDGIDEVELLLAANTGAEPRPLDRGASGGELSRVMLAVEVVLAGTAPVPTFVFDEVDAGVGGSAGVEVGRRLATLARSAQVLVVTHLPQVAAFADRHVVVAKSSDGTVTTSGLGVLEDSDRERELARMFAGLEDSETALAHARELLATARPDR